ncbi:thymidylate kinase [Dissulfurispira thermophila]|uniref:Thymidylate kinase n=2 Tax=root TaxID=1 RepID=A0A7G1H035_9BACT|nr:dTMP kinase [Dissulfurispira thermophila]BCB95662.1 thymidylate kinase [Dissulfurispira thermophila]
MRENQKSKVRSQELKKGIFISFEGIEGTGKTTQAKLLSEHLTKKGYKVILTHEPGGTVIGNRIREILLHVDHREMSYMTELLLYNAARAQHLSEKIIPALNEGYIVITDRFTDSTTAYQGYGRGIDMQLIMSIDSIATGGIKPHLTVLFDLDVEIGLKRNKGINKVDRLELEDIEFHKKVREGYLKIAEAESERIKVIDASLPLEIVAQKVEEIVKWRLEI